MVSRCMVAVSNPVEVLNFVQASKRVWMEGGGGGYKCQLSVKISAICQLSVNWLLIINYTS